MLAVTSVACIQIGGCNVSGNSTRVDAVSQRQPMQVFTYARPLMGVGCRIVIHHTDEQVARDAAAAAFERISSLNTVLSDYDKTSEANIVMHKSPNQWHRLSNDLTHALRRSFQLSELTDGAFDITHGRVYHLWRAAREDEQLPSQDKIEDALQHGGIEQFQLDGTRVMFAKENVQLDFGGIGKGFAADEAMEVLQLADCPIAMIDFGGDIVVGDPPVESSGWAIVVELDHQPDQTLFLSNAAAATSGSTEQFLEVGGRRYSHIIDPRTGWALGNAPNVTIVASDGTTADALASAVSVLGIERGKAILRRRFADVKLLY